MNSAASRYAEALFELGLEENKLETYAADLHIVRSVVEKEPTWTRIFAHSQIDTAEKKQLVTDAFGHLDRDVYHFLLLLVDKGRMALILEIAEAFATLCNHHDGILEGIVYSPYELDEQTVHTLEEGASHKLKQQVKLKVKHDVRLIAGVKIVVEGTVIDGSVRNRMEMLRASLLKESR